MYRVALPFLRIALKRPGKLLPTRQPPTHMGGRLQPQLPHTLGRHGQPSGLQALNRRGHTSAAQQQAYSERACVAAKPPGEPVVGGLPQALLMNHLGKL